MGTYELAMPVHAATDLSYCRHMKALNKCVDLEGVNLLSW